jgi:hypothetical protein
MAIAVGGKYQHRLTGLPCTVIRYYGEQRRVTIKLDDGREFQEVPFHDLLDNPPPAPVAGPLPIQSPGPDETKHPDPAEDEDRDADEDKSTGWPPPRRAS